MGESGSRGEAAKTWTARLMDAPAGSFLVILVGVGVIAFGGMQIRKGWKETFQKRLRLGEMTSEEKMWAMRAGRWGYIARGCVFAVIGLMLIQAAWHSDPGEAQGLEGALDALARQPFGPWLLAFVAGGPACYGIYSVVEARYRKVSH